MAVTEDLIDFDIIESQKENIQSLPGGRSARALASMFSSPLHKLDTPTPSDTRNLNDAIRQEYEIELQNIAESDDPLDIYDRYVKWTLDAYPSAQATPASQLLPLLERATKAFLNSAQYKSDPRYLKLWLSYIRFFSDTPRETFAFLARHNIGESLALFYEEFAAWLEGAGRWTQAEEVYRMGIDKEARPASRLLRKFDEFQQRFAQRPQDANEPSSPALPTVRPALAAKLDPYASAAPRDPQAPRPNSGVGGSTSKSGRQKLQIFSDADEAAPAAITGKDTKGWESIGSLADRKKENVMEPKPWVGETLKAGGKKSSTKMAVFKDESLPRFSYPQITHPAELQVTVNPKGRTERIFVNLEAIYPSPDIVGSELSLEELRASHRGWLSKVWQTETRSKSIRDDSLNLTDSTQDSKGGTDELVKQVVEKLVIARDPVPLDENGVAREPAREGRGRRMKIKEVNETQIIKAKLSSPSGPKMTKRKSKEQTMTLHTRAATDDIYDLFSQPLPTEQEEEEEESETDDDMTDGDYTSGGESTCTGRLASTSEAGDDETSDVKSVSEWSDFTARKHIPNIDDETEEDTRATEFTDADNEDLEAIGIENLQIGSEEELVTPILPDLPPKTMFVPIPPEDYEPPTRPYRDPAQVSQNRLPFMTPIAEKTESSLGMPTVAQDKAYFNSKTPSKDMHGRKRSIDLLGSVDSSPFHDNLAEITREPIAQPLLGKKIKTNNVAPLVTKVQANGGPLAKEIAITSKGPIIKDAQCNPVDEYVRNIILANIQPALSTFDGYTEHKDEVLGRSIEIRKYTKAAAKMQRNASDKTTTNLAMPPILTFPGSSKQYMVKRELGAGAFAPVYLLEAIITGSQSDEDTPSSSPVKGAFDLSTRKSLSALKMEDPPTAWEFYITRVASLRLGSSRVTDSIIKVYEMHLYADECYLIEEFRDQGTLLDVINICRAESTSNVPMDECLAMFFVIELFRTVEALHAKGIMHGDLKADNCLIRFDPLSDTEVWNSSWRRDGTAGWNKKGISLIDFGRGIDMNAFRPDVGFIADWKTSQQDCPEMRELKPWTWQIDYYGLAGIIHSLLFGKYLDTMEIVEEKTEGEGEGSADATVDDNDALPSSDGADLTLGLGGVGTGMNQAIGLAAKKRYKIRENIKRYWQGDLWRNVFDILLNPTIHLEREDGAKMPVLNSMKMVREQMEDWLEANSEKCPGGLQGLIRKLEGKVGAAGKAEREGKGGKGGAKKK